MEKEELIAYCGLYCEDCFGYKGKIASLAGELNKELKDINFKKNADFFAQIPAFKAFKNFEGRYLCKKICVFLKVYIFKFIIKFLCKGGYFSFITETILAV